MRYVACLCALVAFSSVSQAQIIVGYNFSGSAGNQASEVPDTEAIGVTASHLTRGAGLTAVSRPNTINSSGFQSSSNFSDYSNDYYEFTVTPDSGWAMNLTELRLLVTRSFSVGMEGPAFGVVRSSLDAFSSNIGTFGIPGETELLGDPLKTIDLSGDQFQNVTTEVTFRIYAYGTNDSSGQFWLFSPSADSAGDGVQLLGSLSPSAVPEPGSLALLALPVVGFAVAAYRRRRQGQPVADADTAA